MALTSSSTGATGAAPPTAVPLPSGCGSTATSGADALSSSSNRWRCVIIWKASSCRYMASRKSAATRLMYSFVSIVKL